MNLTRFIPNVKEAFLSDTRLPLLLSKPQLPSVPMFGFCEDCGARVERLRTGACSVCGGQSVSRRGLSPSAKRCVRCGGDVTDGPMVGCLHYYCIPWEVRKAGPEAIHKHLDETRGGA